MKTKFLFALIATSIFGFVAIANASEAEPTPSADIQCLGRGVQIHMGRVPNYQYDLAGSVTLGGRALNLSWYQNMPTGGSKLNGSVVESSLQSNALFTIDVGMNQNQKISTGVDTDVVIAVGTIEGTKSNSEENRISLISVDGSFINFNREGQFSAILSGNQLPTNITLKCNYSLY
jgi:hypothetical protein